MAQAFNGQAVLFGVKKADRVGPSSAVPDGKPDAVFSLEIPSTLNSNVDEIEIRGSSGGYWASISQPGAGFIGVALSKNPSKILNPKPSSLKINPKEANQFLLFMTDDGNFNDTARSYQLKITAANGQTWNVAVKNEISDTEAISSESGGPVRMNAVNRGLSQYDAVNPGKQLKGDDLPDGLFQITIDAKDKTITALEIRKIEGTASLWDTIPGSSAGAVGVALLSDPIKLLNQRDGSISLKVKDRVDLNLYVGDNGDIASGKSNFRIAVTFSDGEIAWAPVQNSAQGSPPRTGVTKANFLGSWLGFVATDAVGRYPGLKPDGTADAVFGLDIEVTPRSTITGIELNRPDGSGDKWATGSSVPGAWGLGVAYQTAPSALLNKPDGSISIPIDGRIQLYLYAADPGDIATAHPNYRIIVHLSDGSSFQQMVRKPPASTSTVVPGSADEPGKAKGLITCEFRGFIADLVNTSVRPGKDGYLDGTFILKLQVDEKKIQKIEISGSDGRPRWSSDAKAPVMLLGIAQYPSIYKLMNDKPGPMNIPVGGKRTFYLYAADNGLLSDPKATLTVTVTFTDKSTLSAEVIK